MDASTRTYIDNEILVRSVPVLYCCLAIVPAFFCFLHSTGDKLTLILAVQALANLTGNFNAMSGIISAHQRLGVLDAQGRFTGDIRISGRFP